MENSFWLFIIYVVFVFLIFFSLLVYGVVRNYGWWYVPAILCILIGAFSIDFYFIIFSNTELRTAGDIEHEFIIPKGANLAKIGGILKTQDVIHNPSQFQWIARLLGFEKKLRAGKFKIAGSYSYYDLLKILHKGGNVHEKVTIREGLRTSQIAGILSRSIGLDSTRFCDLVRDSSLCSSLDIPAPCLDGFLLPETYYFNYGIDEEGVIKIMVNQFKMILTDSASKKIKSKDMDLLDYVILASIIEGEAIHDEERKLISAVYYNRLKKNIKLDADPTIQFVIPDGPRRLLNADKLIDSPYNTYMYRGLPPGPINNPGKQSILAAIFPADVDYLYFVAQGDGYHSFSNTYEKHLAAKKKLDQIRRRLQQEKHN